MENLKINKTPQSKYNKIPQNIRKEMHKLQKIQHKIKPTKTTMEIHNLTTMIREVIKIQVKPESWTN